MNVPEFGNPVSQRQRGQSLVEMSLMWIVIGWLMLGLLDLGRVFFYYIALRDAAGEGAYYGSVHPGCKTSADNPDPNQSGECNDPNNVTYRVRNSSPGGLVDWTGAGVAVTVPVGFRPGTDYVTVTVTSSFRLLTPLISEIVGGGTLPLSASATAKILSPGP